ncbi:MAG: sigma-70 family RNA polymerase sigma factor [Richelia sp. RM2_1_2]|nr:sigma-70 family RNA polymerase sigma factor [Richelia sp. RM2_1_2]
MKTQINFDQMYAKMYSKVLQYVSLRITNYEIARDLVSDMFVKIYEKKHTFNSDKSTENTWMWTIVKNSLTDYFRVKKLDEIQISKLINEDGDQIDFRGYSDTFKTVSGNEQMELIIEAINALPPAYREIANLSLVQDLKLADVVAETGKPLNTVKVMTMRVKQMLVNKLQYLA